LEIRLQPLLKNEIKNKVTANPGKRYVISVFNKASGRFSEPVVHLSIPDFNPE